ncbi:hypothetical protein VTK26DRAFT_7829 [Humicola hyalothermophila]
MTMALKECSTQTRLPAPHTKALEPTPTPPPSHWFRLWSPPRDSERPPNPYIVGFSVDISKHVPPSPIDIGGPAYGPGGHAIHVMRDVDLQKVTQTQLVMMFPPLEPKAGIVDSSPPQKASLTITKTIRVGDERRAQVVVCSIQPEAADGNAKPFIAVAKIYDPLY